MMVISMMMVNQEISASRQTQPKVYKPFLPGCEFSTMIWWLLCSTFDNFLRPTETT